MMDSVQMAIRQMAVALGTVQLLLCGGLRAEFIEISGSASQTSEWNGGQFPAGLAVDGNPATFNHTDTTTPNNGWELVLEELAEVARVEVSMRADCCGGRMTGVVLRAFDEEGDSVFSESLVDPGIGNTVSVNLSAGLSVKRIRLGFENGGTNPGATTSMLHFGEVRVFAEAQPLPEVVSFAATPGGAGASLSWTTVGADEVRLYPGGLVVASNGSLEVTPDESSVYSIEATNERGVVTESLAVLVNGALLPVRLNEFMASNSGSLVRSDGSTPDWIELWNPNPVAVDLGGYGLSDDINQARKFVFPPMLLPAGGYLVVDAAEGSVDGVVALGFQLDRSEGGVVILSDSEGGVLQNLSYPRQVSDLSYGSGVDGAWTYFREASPGGSPRGDTVLGFVEDTRFSVGRGFYEEGQMVEITSATEGATIYYSLDGAEPGPGSAVYEAPLTISATTVLRAAAYLDGWEPTDVDTQTYVFASQVAGQSGSPAQFPQQWVPNLNGVQAGVSAYSHFGMNEAVLGTLPLLDGNGESFDFIEALKAIPTMSLVVDADELFDPADGLHVNARQRGRPWERAASIEVIDPRKGTEVQANCGLRMHGGWNRFPEMLKKSFRLYFRSEYGDAKLEYPLFENSEIDQFDRLILRSGNGKAWASPWRALAGGGNSLERVTYLRDQFMRELQRAMGGEAIPGSFVHLYLNGHYWGLYNPVERPTEHFAAARHGGDDDDYDVIKWLRGTGHQVAAGDDAGWNELIGLVRGDLTSNYAAIAQRLDLDGFVDYMLVNFFSGNGDWIDNNVYAMRNRVVNGPFRFYCWDSEESLLSVGADITERNVADTCAEIHQALRVHPDYRVLFGDRVQKHLFNHGALTGQETRQVLDGLVLQIDRAVVGESARWGELLRPADPYDRADWWSEVMNLRGNYLGARESITVAQMRVDSLYPAVDVPVFSPQRGGQVIAGASVALEAGSGKIYYTLDGSDPRLPGGGVSESAIEFEGGRIDIAGDALIRTRVLDAGEWSALDEARYFVGDRAREVRVSELMYHPSPGGAEFLELENVGGVSHRLDDLRLTGGIQFDFGEAGVATIAPGERLILVRDTNNFSLVYPGTSLAGRFEGALGNGGDEFSLVDDDGLVLWTLSYGDDDPWPAGTDGDGRSLIYMGGEMVEAGSWRPSLQFGGNPGSSDRLPGGVGSDLLEYGVISQGAFRGSEGAGFEVVSPVGSDAVVLLPEWSGNLETWNREGLCLLRQEISGGVLRRIWQREGEEEGRQFFRVRVRSRF